MNEDIYLNWSDRQSDWERLAKRVARLEVDMKESLKRIPQTLKTPFLIFGRDSNLRNSSVTRKSVCLFVCYQYV